MKKALSVALMATLSLVLFLGAVHAETASELLEKELAATEAVFDQLKSFVGELIGEIKGNMAEIARVDEDVKDLRDVVSVLSAEIKTAEGRIVGLRKDVDVMAGVQQEFKVRLVALEAGLSELSTFCEEYCNKLGSTLNGTRNDLARLGEKLNAWVEEYNAFEQAYAAFKASVEADIFALKKGHEGLAARVQALEEQDVGTFKKKVLELERSMSALAIKIDNNRAKLEGFDHAIVGLAGQVEANKTAILGNMSLLEDHEARLMALEDGTMLTDLQDQVNTLYFLAIIGLLAGVGALLWGFLGS